jgi:hypothetical protein
MNLLAHLRAIRTGYRKRSEFLRMEKKYRNMPLDKAVNMPAICLQPISETSGESPREQHKLRIEALRAAVQRERTIWNRIDLTFDEQTFKRQKSLKFLKLQIELVKYFGGRTVVEIGSARAPLRHPISEFNPVCCNDGHSSHHWASEQSFDVHTVDIDPRSKATLEEAGYPNLRAYTHDGVGFLAAWSGAPIDLLYLDAWDVGTPNYAERHLEAFQAARNKLARLHVIGIDDTDFAGAGKGKLLVPHLTSIGYSMIADGRQTVFVNEWPK